MIPPRSSSRDNNGNGVSCRVEACRRRLRSIRAGKMAEMQVDSYLRTEEISLGKIEVDHGSGHGLQQTSIEGLEEAGIT